MKLSKVIPAHRKTVKFRWAYKNFTQYNHRFKAVRDNMRSKLDHCDWCQKKFQIDEPIALAQPLSGQKGPKRNWVLCHNCADEMGAMDRKDIE